MWMGPSFEPIEKLFAQVTDGQLGVGLAVRVMPPLIQQVEQGILGGIFVLPPLASLVRQPPTFVHHQPRWKKGFARRDMDASSKKKNCGESVSRGGGCVLIGAGPADPPSRLLYQFHPVWPGEKWQRKVAGGKNRPLGKNKAHRNLLCR